MTAPLGSTRPTASVTGPNFTTQNSVSVSPNVDPSTDLLHKGVIDNAKDSRAGVNVGDSFSASSGLSAQTSGNVAGVDVSGHVEGPSLNVNANASATASINKGIEIKVDANVDATLVSAGADAKKTFPVTVNGQKFDVTLDLGATGKVGADGNIHIKFDIGRDGKLDVSASVDGFAGAKAGLTGTISVAHNGDTLASGALELDATAGVSGSAGASVSLDHGQLKFDAHADGAAGAGLGFHVHGNADPLAIAKTVDDMFLGGAVEKGVQVAENTAGTVVNAGKDVVGKAGDVAGNVGSWVSGHV